jgi:hypothetical protein
VSADGDTKKAGRRRGGLCAVLTNKKIHIHSKKTQSVATTTPPPHLYGGEVMGYFFVPFSICNIGYCHA